MGLIDLKTDLKSIKYGHDRPGGGNSGQPYITNDINNPKNTLGFDDGLIRGGAIGAAKHSISDTLRIGKFLIDAPQGPLFIAKQVGLQLSNPKIETRKVTLNNGSGVLGFLGNAFNALNNTLGPTRIYNLGINTIAQIPVEAFGGHFTRHGLLPVQTDASKYEAVVKSNNQNNNRLVGLATKFQLGKEQTSFINTNTFKLINAVTGLLNQTIGLSIPTLKPAQLTIDDYISGPGSVYGIGSTLINRYSFTADSSAIKLAKAQSSQYAGKTRNDNGGPTALNYGRGVSQNVNALSNYDFPQAGSTSGVDQNAVKYSLPSFGNPALKTYAVLQKQIEEQNSRYSTGYKIAEFAVNFTDDSHDAIGNQLPTSTNSPFYMNAFGDVIKINMPWNKVTRELRVGSGRQDQINLTPIFFAKAGTHGDEVKINGTTYNINDLVKFRIQAINTDTPSNADWMIFRAYITQISDSVDAQWSDIKYAGRGEKFYVYDGFSRKMTVGFKVAALSAQEMEPMYQKLNYLMGNLMPDYSNNGLMRGPLMRMTIGNYIDGQLCKLDSLSYSIPQDSPWEIALDSDNHLILPHIIEVTLSFTPIGSQTKGENKIAQKSFSTSHIAQNINDYQYITGSIQWQQKI